VTAAKEHKYWLALIRAPGIGPAQAAELLQQFGTPETLFDAGPGAWRKAGIPGALQEGLRKPDWDGVEADLKWLGRERRALVTWSDAAYPGLLRQVASPPLALFCQGDPALLARQQLAIVGARTATRVGQDTAHGFAAEMTRCGVLVTSGLAQGIDGSAHRGALAAGGATLAVCATGLDRVYPAKHRELAHEIAEKGLLVSEFPTGTPPLPDHFVRRNRIISGLSLGVLVVEAAQQSGSLTTARLALEQGREVFAIPGSIHSPLSRGVHQLIRQGAKLTETVHDILEELAPHLTEIVVPPASAPDTPARKLEPTHQRVLDALGFEATAFDVLIERLSLSVEELSAALLSLELQGFVTPAAGGAFARRFRQG